MPVERVPWPGGEERRRSERLLRYTTAVEGRE
jgi:hypothetical protein